MPLNGQFLDKSGLTYLWSKLKTKLAAKQDTIADLVDIRSGAAAGATAVQQTEFETDQQRQETEIGAVANAGAKNLLDYTFSINGNTSARTSNGVTFAINADGSISTSGTASATVTSAWIQKNYVVPDDPVILSGCPAGGADNKYRIDILDGTPTSSVVAVDYGNGVVIKSSMFTNGTGLIRIRIQNGQNVDGLVFKPMIRPASITDDTFVPYAKTNRELTVAEDEDRAALIAQVDGGAKNSFNINASPIVYHTTYTLTGDKLNVSADGSWAHYSVPVDLPAGDYILSLAISGYSKASKAPDTSMRIRMSATTSGGTSVILQTITGNGNMSVPFTWTGGQIYLQFYPNYNTTSYANSFVAEKVMICRVADYAISPAFVPYTKTNRELTVAEDEDRAALIAQVDSGAKNIVNLNTNFTSHTHKGITYTNNGDGSINVSGTSSSVDSYITLYDINTDNLFGIQKGETVALQSTSNNVSISLVYKKQDGGYGLTVYGYKDSPGTFTIPSDFVGFLLRVGVMRKGTTVNEDVGGMICTAADYAISPAFVPYRPSWQEMYEMIKALQNGA